MVEPFHACCVGLAESFQGSLSGSSQTNVMPAAAGGGAGLPALPQEGDEEAVQAAAVQWVRSGWLKAPSRAGAKAAGCYGGDVSRLVDACRARIAFESVGV